jgi:multisubunit Na+/H+ antiporter MnhC subunit
MFIPAFMKRSGVVSSEAMIYLSMVIQQSTAIVSMMIGTYLVTTRLGRKWTQSLSLILAGVCLYAFLLVKTYAEIMVSSSGFFFFLLMAYGAQYTITPESYPTNVRNTGLGLCSTINRVGMLIAPLVSGELLD